MKNLSVLLVFGLRGVETMLHVVRNRLHRTHFQLQSQLVEVSELERVVRSRIIVGARLFNGQLLEEPQRRRRVGVHDHLQLACLAVADGLVRKLDQHGHELLEVALKAQVCFLMVELLGVDPKKLQNGHLLVDVLHKIVVVGSQLEAHDFKVLLAAHVGCFESQSLRVR